MFSGKADRLNLKFYTQKCSSEFIECFCQKLRFISKEYLTVIESFVSEKSPKILKYDILTEGPEKKQNKYDLQKCFSTTKILMSFSYA